MSRRRTLGSPRDLLAFAAAAMTAAAAWAGPTPNLFEKQDPPTCITVVPGTDPPNLGVPTIETDIADNPCTDPFSYPEGTELTVTAPSVAGYAFYEWARTIPEAELIVPFGEERLVDQDGDGTLQSHELACALSLRDRYKGRIMVRAVTQGRRLTAVYQPISLVPVVDFFPVEAEHNTGTYPRSFDSDRSLCTGYGLEVDMDGNPDFGCGAGALLISNSECHDGFAMDLHGVGGEPVIAAQSGTIEFECFTAGGISVRITDSRKWSHSYRHLDAVCREGSIQPICAFEGGGTINGGEFASRYPSEFSGYCMNSHLLEGSFVEKGTVIGFLGKTGSANDSNPHVHYELDPDQVDLPDGVTVSSCNGLANPFPRLRLHEQTSCNPDVDRTPPAVPTGLAITPADGRLAAPSSTVTLRWSPVPGADSYRVTLRDDGSAAEWLAAPAAPSTFQTVDLFATGHDASEYRSSMTFTWDVRAVRSGIESAPAFASDEEEVELALTPDPPSGLLTTGRDERYILQWDGLGPGSAGSTISYHLELQDQDSEGNWVTRIDHDAAEVCTGFDPAAPSCERFNPAPPVRWRVRAVHTLSLNNASQVFEGDFSDWSYFPPIVEQGSIDEPFRTFAALDRFDVLGGGAAAAEPSSSSVFGFFVDLIQDLFGLALRVEATVDSDAATQKLRYRPFVELVVGAEYELSAQIKKDNVDNPRVHLDYYNAEFERLGTGETLEAKGGKSGWSEVRTIVTVPATLNGQAVSYGRMVLEAGDKKRDLNSDPAAPGETRFDNLYFSREITPGNDRPVITSTPVTVGREGRPYRYDVDATDSDPIVYSLDGRGIPGGMTIDPASGLVSWEVPEGAAGDYRISVVAADFGSRDTQTYTLAVAANSPPRIVNEGTAPRTVREGAVWSHTVAASDADGDPLAFTLNSAPSGMTIDPDTGAMEWEAPPHDPDGSNVYFAEVSVSDGLATDFEDLFITVLGPGGNQPPEITNRGESAPKVVQKSDYFHRVEARDADGDLLTFTLTSAPEGMTIDASGEILWTAPRFQANSSNVYFVEVVVDDGLASDFDQFFVTVIKTNSGGPGFVDTEDIRDELGDGQTYRHRLRATDPDATPLAFGLVSGPFDMEVDRYDGEITWPTDDQDIGSRGVSVEVSDGELVDRHSFSLVVHFGLDLGSVALGGSFTRPFFLVSTGGSPVVLGTLRIRDEADVDDFAVTLDECSNRSLPPGESCRIEVTFRPLSAGEKWVFLEIPTNVPGAPIATSVPFGVGTAGAAAAAPASEGVGTAGGGGRLSIGSGTGPSLLLIRP